MLTGDEGLGGVGVYYERGEAPRGNIKFASAKTWTKMIIAV